MHPAIVILAFNRPDSLKRLVHSVLTANYPNALIPLIFSIDANGDPALLDAALSVEWPFGPKEVVVQENHLGLRRHVLACGELTRRFGSIILLEDDVFVAPGYYRYAQSACSHFESWDNVAGISLYAYEIAEDCRLPFEPLHTGPDVFLMQVACSWGQVWTEAWWNAFLQWEDSGTGKIPEYALEWSGQSWKKEFFAYMRDAGKYFVYPYRSFATNFHERGTHSQVDTALFQSTLTLDPLPELCFPQDSHSVVCYDAWFEPEPRMFPELNDYSFDVDLFGRKSETEVSADFVLTTRRGLQPVLRFGGSLRPLAGNVRSGMVGNDIGLYPREHVRWERKAFLKDVLPAYQVELLNGTSQIIGLSVIIPLSSGETEALKKTMESLGFGVEWIVVADNTVKELPPDVRVVHESGSLREKVLAGFRAASFELLTWCLPGTVFQPDLPDTLNAIFPSFPFIQWASGVGHRTMKQLAHERWTLSSLQRFGKTYPGTELHIFRRSFLEQRLLQSSVDIEQWYPYLLGFQPQYLVLAEFGTPVLKKRYPVDAVIRSMDSGHWPSVRHGFMGKVTGRCARIFFTADIPYLRSIYKELEKLPFVLRFDEENRTFYSSGI